MSCQNEITNLTQKQFQVFARQLLLCLLLLMNINGQIIVEAGFSFGIIQQNC
jgi:hypothetical protein